jgi:glyoxylase-like metal-dependent hydrolase (beta-lactamase superfamily II)
MKTLPYYYAVMAVLGMTAAISVDPVYATRGTPSLNHPNLTKVSERVYALIGDMDDPNERNQGFICNSTFVITDEGVVVVDPGGSVQVGRMIIAEIRKLTDKPITHVINTHHHADHWMGNHAFDEVKPRPAILAHAVMRETAGEIGERWLGIIADMTKGSNKGTRVVLPHKTVRGGETLKIGGLTFVLHHPGHAHTKGDLAVFIPEERVLIAGDILFYLRTPGFQDASPLGNARALRELLALDAERIVPGHGPVTDKSGIHYMLDYITLLHAEVKKFYEQGLTDYDMKDKLNVGKYRDMSGFKNRFGINVNRMYLEVEANSF